MWQLRFWSYLLLVALSLAPVQRVVACTCRRSHPQTLFCNSDFGKSLHGTLIKIPLTQFASFLTRLILSFRATVALVRVKKVTNPNEHEVGYNVKVSKIFKVRESMNIL